MASASVVLKEVVLSQEDGMNILTTSDGERFSIPIEAMEINTGDIIPLDSGTHLTICQDYGTSAPAEETQTKTKLWGSGNIPALLSLMKKYDKDFQTGVKKYIWQKISKEITELTGSVLTPQQCDTKWQLLKDNYKGIKDHNNKSGNSVKTWEYYDEIDEILNNKPEITAEATCSSSTGLVVRGKRSLPDTINKTEDALSTEATKYSSIFTSKRQKKDNVIERRHLEKLERQDRFLNIIERMAAAVEENLKAAPNEN